MIYVVAKLDITNPQALTEYREVAGPALAKHGGKPVAGAGATTVLEGGASAPDTAAIFTFSDKESALAWINDPELADVHDLRRSAGTSDILLLG